MCTHTDTTKPLANSSTPVRRIVVGADLSEPSNGAVAVALRLAASFGADLSILHVVPDPCDQPWAKEVGCELADLLDCWVREAEARLHQFATTLDPGQVATVVRVGRAADEILAFAESTGVDLIVVGRRGTRPSGHDHTGAVAGRVLERAHCPVVMVPPSNERLNGSAVAAVPASGVRGVLVASDLDEASNAALAFARALGRRLVCPVHVLHVVESPWTRSPAYIPPSPDTIESLRRAAMRRLEVDDATSAPPCWPMEVRRIVRVGDPATEILRCAEELENDLIVVGTHGRGALRRMLLGSVARDVVGRSTCPTVTVPSGRASGDQRRQHENELPVATADAAGVTALKR